MNSRVKEIAKALELDDSQIHKYLKGDEKSYVQSPLEFFDVAIEHLQNRGKNPGGILPWDIDFNILPHTLTIWAGMNGHGKSLIVQQVMLYLMTGDYSSREEKVLMWSPELAPVYQLERLARQIVGDPYPDPEEAEEAWCWLNNKLWLYTREIDCGPEQLIAAARYAQEELGVTQFVIDSLMKVNLGSQERNIYLAQKNFANVLANVCRDTGICIHLVAHVRKPENELKRVSKYDIKGASELTELVDAGFMVHRNKTEEKAREEGNTPKEPLAALECFKNRHGGHEPSCGLEYEHDGMTFFDHDTKKENFYEKYIGQKKSPC